MALKRLSHFTGTFVAAMLVLAMLPLGSSASAQVNGNSYTSPMYGFTVDWTSDWEVRTSYDQDYGVGLIYDDIASVYVDGLDPSNTPESIIAAMDGETVVMEDTSGVPARGVFEREDGFNAYLESYTIYDGEVTILISIYAAPEDLAAVVEYAYEGLSLDGEELILGDPLEESTSTTDSIETPVATEQTVTQEEGAFTSAVYGYSVEYDPEIWELGGVIEEGNVDGVSLRRDSTALTIWAWDAYGGDPLVCLQGEEDFYSNELENISDWTPRTDRNGDELRHESDTLAWGVFDLTYTNDSGQSYPLVDYISCEPIPGKGASLIVLLSSNPSTYDDDLELTLDILDTLQFEEVSGTDVTPEPDNDGDTVEIDTNLVGSEYISPNWGFSANIPLEWHIVEEGVDGTNETLIVTNGTSVVTLWATDEYVGDLAGCVDFAADASGLDLQIDEDASGGDFRGVYRNEAYGNFVYDDGGTEMMYFINCRAIPGTDGFLILTHDVEYAFFSTERAARAEIENSIVLPED